jgi:hypothetical protein
MSRILRRPMFRGGPASSDGVGITSGLDTPKRGLVDGPGGYAGEERSDIALEDIYKPYNLYGDTVRLLTNLNEAGYNYGVRPVLNLPKIASNYVFGTEFEQTPKVDLSKKIIESLSNEEIEKIRTEKEKKKKVTDIKQPFKPEIEPEVKSNLGNVPMKSDFKTVYEDLLPIFKEHLGPNSDEYTRQKYLELSKFGLNLLKPTPAGIKPSLLSSIATAAEKPLEGYQNILSREAQAEMLPKQLAAQAALSETQLGQYGKNLRDLMNQGYTRDEAIGILTKADSAAQKKQTAAEVDALSSKLIGVKQLAEHKSIKENPLLLDQLAETIVKYDLPRIAFKVLPENKENRKNGEFYFDPISLQAGKYKNGSLLHPKDPGYNN